MLELPPLGHVLTYAVVTTSIGSSSAFCTHGGAAASRGLWGPRVQAARAALGRCSADRAGDHDHRRAGMQTAAGVLSPPTCSAKGEPNRRCRSPAPLPCVPPPAVPAVPCLPSTHASLELQAPAAPLCDAAAGRPRGGDPPAHGADHLAPQRQRRAAGTGAVLSWAARRLQAGLLEPMVGSQCCQMVSSATQPCSGR